MKVYTALFAAALMAAGASSAIAAPDSEAKNWIVGVRRGTAADPAPSLRNRPVRRFASIDAYAVQMTDAEAATLRASGEVRYVEPDLERHLYRAPAGPRRWTRTLGVSAPATARGAMQTVPYGVDLVRARSIWQYGRGGGIKVGIIDTGVDYNHPDLKDAYRGGDDFINDKPGVDDTDPMDDHGHGTHVAGTIAAADNQFGVVGIAPEVEIYALKVLKPAIDGSATGTVSAIIDAVDWAIEHDLDVINLSLGSAESSIPEREAFARAWDAGILAVAASGNDYAGIDIIGFPAAYPNVLAVGAIDQQEGIADFSQRGTELALVGPGVSVLSTLPVGTAAIADVAVDGEFLPEVGTPDGTPTGEFTGGFVNCGTGNLSEIPASVSGRIALIKRGGTSATTPSGFTFNEKVRNAKTRGAAAVIIYNHENSPLTWTLIRSDSFGNPVEEELPLTAAISKSEGEALLLKPASSVTVAVSPYDYELLQGTSMATPHVAGVAALAWSLTPEASAAQVREALTSSGRDLGNAGWDSTFGFGVVDALRAARSLAPEVFGVPPRQRPAMRPRPANTP